VKSKKRGRDVDRKTGEVFILVGTDSDFEILQVW
jgi:hypothetical protein